MMSVRRKVNHGLHFLHVESQSSGPRGRWFKSSRLDFEGIETSSSLSEARLSRSVPLRQAVETGSFDAVFSAVYSMHIPH
jgi:hypothetical protein